MRSKIFATGCAGTLACLMVMAPRTAAAADMPSVGAPAPSFSLPSQEDKLVSLADYKGKWVVLYFYPKDQTTGCTIEAHNFQRDQAQFDAKNAVIVGVSVDTPDSHSSEVIGDVDTVLAALRRNRAARNRYQATRAHHDMRTWQVERRKRTRHLIELGGLVVKAGIVDLTGDDRAMIYGALLWMADKLQSDERDKALALWTAKGKQAFEDN